jgi:hypothetical protein
VHIIQCAHHTVCTSYSVHIIQCAHHTICTSYSVHIIPCAHHTVCTSYSVHIIQCAHHTVCTTYKCECTSRLFISLMLSKNPRSMNNQTNMNVLRPYSYPLGCHMDHVSSMPECLFSKTSLSTAVSRPSPLKEPTRLTSTHLRIYTFKTTLSKTTLSETTLSKTTHLKLRVLHLRI